MVFVAEGDVALLAVLILMVRVSILKIAQFLRLFFVLFYAHLLLSQQSIDSVQIGDLGDQRNLVSIFLGEPVVEKLNQVLQVLGVRDDLVSCLFILVIEFLLHIPLFHVVQMREGLL